MNLSLSRSGKMFSSRSSVLALRAHGPLALFTQPAFKVERVTYPVMTPSAARGMLEAVLWKPAIRWRVVRISVLNPIQYIAFRRNELNSKAVAPRLSVVRDGGRPPRQFIEYDRAQRNTIALRNVDYVIEADFDLTERAGADDSVAKFEDMFRRRVEKGQHFHQPYFGCREFVAHILSSDNAPPPIEHTCDLGQMLWDIVYDSAGNRAVFFKARLDRGVLNVPTDPER